MRLSLRGLLIIAGAVAVCVAALLYGGAIISGIAVAATCVLTIVMLIRAAVDHGASRAAAIGFAIPALAYGSLLVITGGPKSDEFDPYDGKLPTTRLLRPIIEWAWSQQTYYLDPQGKVSKTPPPAGTSIMSARPGQPGWGGNWRLIEIPHRDDFMPTAHALWALLFGHLGSRYATRRFYREISQTGRAHSK